VFYQISGVSIAPGRHGAAVCGWKTISRRPLGNCWPPPRQKTVEGDLRTAIVTYPGRRVKSDQNLHKQQFGQNTSWQRSGKSYTGFGAAELYPILPTPHWSPPFARNIKL